MCSAPVRTIYFAIAFIITGVWFSDLVVARALPDLRVTHLEAPAKALPGESILVKETTKNSKSPAPASFTRYFLSLDRVLDGSDVVLGHRAVPPLDPGISDQALSSLIIPTGTTMGTHYLIAMADGDNTVAEAGERNNVLAKVIGIGPGPDLCTYIYAPSVACVGTTLIVKDVTKSMGFSPSPASVTSIYLSTDPILDAGDLLIGSRNVPALNPGQSNTGSISWPIPASLPFGTYTLFAVSDGPNLIVEINEANNEASKKILINCGPEVCGDGIDNDGDGQIDEGCVEICGDGIDNDGDGQIDEGCVEICGDGIDNDGDGQVDEGCVEICGDGVDNDGDGQVDEGCVEICGDGIDNDGDGQIDEGCVEICGDGIDNDGDGLIDENCPTPGNPGTGTPGYWKNHLEAWPVSSIVIGGVTYAKEVAAPLLGHPVSGDKTYTMFRHLVAAKLNVLIGNDASCVSAQIAQADAWMASFPLGSGVDASSTAWAAGGPLATYLDEYNNGQLCAPPRD
jgi:hypothetical protein